MRIRAIAIAVVSSLLLASIGTASAAQETERAAPRMTFNEVQSWLKTSSPELIRRTARLCTEAEGLQIEVRVLRRERMVRMLIASMTNPYAVPSVPTSVDMRLTQLNLQAQIDHLGPLCPAAIGYVAGEANE